MNWAVTIGERVAWIQESVVGMVPEFMRIVWLSGTFLMPRVAHVGDLKNAYLTDAMLDQIIVCFDIGLDKCSKL